MNRTAVAIALLALLSCAPQQQAQQPVATAGTGPVAVQQPQGLPAVNAARDTAINRPGPRSAYFFAKTVHDAIAARHYLPYPQLMTRDVASALQVLDATKTEIVQDQALLLTWAGILQFDLGQRELATKILHEALALAPINMAAGALVNHYGGRGELDQVFAVCSSVAPVLTVHEERFQLTQHCMQHSQAISREGALSWAPADLSAWFNAEEYRRSQIQAQQARAAEERQRQQQYQDQQRQHQEQLRRQEAARNRSNNAVATYACSQECRESSYDCQSECNDNGACEYGCSSKRDRCLRDCKQ